MLKRIVDFSHQLLQDTVNKGDLVIDATAGNGHDTLFLSDLVGANGHVYAFDIQEQAIASATAKLKEKNITNTTIIHDGHEQVANYLRPQETIRAAIFNLGYLPGSDKSIITTADTTITSVKTILDYLDKNGLIILVIYHGHQGGEEEKDAIMNFTENLKQEAYHVLQYGFINQKNNPPFIIAIEKR